MNPMETLSHLNAIDSMNVDFETIFNATYDEYQITIEGITAETAFIIKAHREKS